MKWIPNINESYYNHTDYKKDKLICCSSDKRILCIDSLGKLFAAMILDVTILCIDCDGLTIYGGCDDGSIRVWILDNGIVKEIYRYIDAHEHSVTAIHVNIHSNLLISGGYYGTLRLFQIIQN